MTVRRWVDHATSVFDQDISNNTNLSSTTPAEVYPKVVARFIAPTSGKVLIGVGGAIRGQGQLIYLGYTITELQGDRTEVVAFADFQTFSAPTQATGFIFGTASYVATGLTPGKRYAARTLYEVGGGSTADIRHRDIVVEPIP